MQGSLILFSSYFNDVLLFDFNNYPYKNEIAFADGFVINISHEKHSIITNFFINNFILSTIIINYLHLLTKG